MISMNRMREGVAIVAGARTPMTRAGTLMKDLSAVELGRRVMQEALYRAGWPAERLDEVLMGNVIMPADAANVSRVAALWAGIPDSVPAMTVQRNCASGMEAVADAALRIGVGQSRAILAGGTESMSRVPLVLADESIEPLGRLAKARGFRRRAGAMLSLRPRFFKPIAALQQGLTDPTCGLIMGQTAEILAREWSISRSEQDQYALESHQKAVAAQKAGRFDEEIVPVYAGKKFEPVLADNGPRPTLTFDALAKMKPIFDKRDGTVTIGNSCQITDGAAAVLAADVGALDGRTPLGFVRAYATAALDPARMGLGPVYALDKLLTQTGLQLGDIDLFEINEAFAAQVLACLSAMASPRFASQRLNRASPWGEIPRDRLNVNGGAIALGHPVGMTGARLVLSLLHEMKRRDAHLGLAALCVGGGQGAAILLERRST